MKRLQYRIMIGLVVVIFMLVLTSGCGQIATDSNFTLNPRETVAGSLLVFSQNAILEEGSSVDGSVVMLCCNLTVNGEVDGDVFLMTGNIKVNTSADVSGDVNVISGNVSQ